MNIVVLIASVLLGATGQILMKWGIVSPKPVWQQGPAFIRLIASWPVLAGLLCYGLSSVCWLLALRKMDLSYAYPLVSVGYIVVLIAGNVLFHETVPPVRWLGVAFILTGVLFVART